MGDLSIWQYVVIVYISLYIFKIFLVSSDFIYIAKARIKCGNLKVGPGWSYKGYVRLVAFFYGIGAALALLVLLIPTISKEGFSFFVAYARKDLDHLAEHGTWS